MFEVSMLGLHHALRVQLLELLLNFELSQLALSPELLLQVAFVDELVRSCQVVEAVGVLLLLHLRLQDLLLLNSHFLQKVFLQIFDVNLGLLT